MYQNAQRVNVEFLKSSTMKGRIIKLNYNPAQVPAQLYGRVDLARAAQPFSRIWRTLLAPHPCASIQSIRDGP